MPLNPGSIAFTGFSADGDGRLAFVALDDIAAGTTIYFTNGGVNGTVGLQLNLLTDSVWSLTVAETIAAGTSVEIAGLNGGLLSIGAGLLGLLGLEVNALGGNQLSGGGETVFAFIGSGPQAPATYLAAITTGGFSGSASLAGTGLVNGQTAVDLSAVDLNADIAAVRLPASEEARSAAELAAAINSAANWVTQDGLLGQHNDGIFPDTPFGMPAPMTIRRDGTSASETLNGTAGNDEIFAGGGDDVVNGAGGDDILHGGSGADTLSGGAGTNILYGDAGDDLLIGDAGTDEMRGSAGIDTVDYSLSDAAVSIAIDRRPGSGGHAAGDRLINVENIVGSPFDDRLTGDANVNRLEGGAGADIIAGRGNADMLIGGDGDDLFLAEGNMVGATVDGGSGNDRIVAVADDTNIAYAGLSGIESIDGGGRARVTIDGTQLPDVIDLTGYALSGIDLIRGLSGNDLLRGNGDANALSGGGDDDRIEGGAGDDLICGNRGADMLFGGDGADVFILTDRRDSRVNEIFRDTIMDFERGTDIIDLSAVDAFETGGGSFTFIGEAAFSGVAGELRIRSTAGGLMLEGDTDGQGEPDLAILFAGLTMLDSADIVL